MSNESIVVNAHDTCRSSRAVVHRRPSENSTVGTFRRMCEETGEYEELVDLARRAEAQRAAMAAELF
ncbi:hypothetical protein BC831DRAFT_470182 [Entophlyctis helioformis]|nr:hypothetical protein BC831DRAFT_470182 [Entophlyctis helioformis]